MTPGIEYFFVFLFFQSKQHSKARSAHPGFEKSRVYAFFFAFLVLMKPYEINGVCGRKMVRCSKCFLVGFLLMIDDFALKVECSKAKSQNFMQECIKLSFSCLSFALARLGVGAKNLVFCVKMCILALNLRALAASLMCGAKNYFVGGIKST